MIRSLTLLALSIIAAGCSGPDSHTLGRSFTDQKPVATVADVQKKPVDSSVVLRGAITDKCPIAGCWFVLQDAAGKIKVDTKNGGFVVTDIPLQSTVTVAGSIVTNGNERFIDATGLRY